VSTQCPECGFDLELGKACRVCGYLPGAAGAKARPSSGEPVRRPLRQRSYVAFIASAVGLLILLGTLIMLDRKSRLDDAATASPVSAAPVVAAPGPATDTALAPAPGVIAPASVAFDVTARTEHPPTTDKGSFVAWMMERTDQKPKYLEAKWDRAQVLLKLRYITHDRLLEAFLRTPREYFCRDPRRAYDNAALPIRYGQTISGPHMVSRMTDWLDPHPAQKVLEIGTGSGYQSALLSEMVNHVYSIEIVEPLALETDGIYKKYEPKYPEYRNIHRKVDDGYYGWPEYAPFDRIIVTCGIDHVPPELLRQLSPEGVMVIPVGPPSGQTILRITKHVSPDGSVSLDREDIYQGKHKEVFVPFTSKTGRHSSGGGTAGSSSAGDGTGGAQ
jgi:protein-L-isoaspartate(D-aspartate) O-methyltransferase